MDRILRVAPLALMTMIFGPAAPAAWATPPVSTIGSTTEQSAIESADSPGPELAGPVRTIRRLPPLEEPSKTSLAKKTRPGKISAPTASPLKAAKPNKERSEQLERVARQADGKTRHGFELAGRGAYFAARSEFLGALRLIAEGLDTEQKTDVHGRALTAALTAMKEADDFLPGGSRLETGFELPRIIAAHTTPVLKTDAENLTSMTALKRYFTFAQERFAAAAGREVAGSMALHALGKLHNALARKKNSLKAAAESKAMVYYQAAMLVYPENFMAANDLGVLLAQCENYRNARTMLEHSLSLRQRPATWCNLAVVYRQLGQTALADRADRQAAMLRQVELARRKASSAVTNDVVLWVDPQTFATTSTNTPNSPGATPRPPARAAGLPTRQQ